MRSHNRLRLPLHGPPFPKEFAPPKKQRRVFQSLPLSLPRRIHGGSTRSLEPKESKRDEPVPARPIQEDPIFTERSLPILKELLPSVGQTRKDNNGPIPLNTSDPKYKTYLQDVQQIIDANWNYPDLALQYGLQGTVIIEFVIVENGRVEGLRLIRSSGFRLLDEEVFRAIMASSPFRRLPSWIEPRRLWVSATMEYHDGRFKAWLTR